MRVKIFKGATAEGLEGEINEWLATIPQGTQIAETQTAVAAARELSMSSCPFGTATAETIRSGHSDSWILPHRSSARVRRG